MILLDVNVAIALHRADHPHHELATQWFTQVLDEERQFSVLDETWSGFVRVTTNRRIYPVPTPLADAFAFLHAIRRQPGHVDVHVSGRRVEMFERLCSEYECSGDLIPDAFLAAAALILDATVASFDRDFARFEDLRWERPSVNAPRQASS